MFYILYLLLDPELAPVITFIELTTPRKINLTWFFPDDIEIFNSWEINGYHLEVEPLFPIHVLNKQKDSFNVTPAVDTIQMQMFNSFSLYKVSIAAFNWIGYGPSFEICFATGEDCKTAYLFVCLQFYFSFLRCK